MMNSSTVNVHTPANQTNLPPRPPVREQLHAHLRQWLGVWPPHKSFEIVVAPERDRPGWDGKVRPIEGLLTPEGSVLSVSPRHERLFENIDPKELVTDLDAPNAGTRLSDRLGVPINFGMALWRWSEKAAELPAVGEWVAANDPRLPPWLNLFQGSVLAAFDERHAFIAGVGIKQHDEWARELSVGTDQHHRGQGYASMLVAQAARDIITRGGVPIYRHEAHNSASARVAVAAGFPDRNWHSIDIQPEIPDEHPARKRLIPLAGIMNHVEYAEHEEGVATPSFRWRHLQGSLGNAQPSGT